MSARPNTFANTSELEAAEWLERRNAGDWSEADQTGLDAWLSQSPLNEVAYLRLDSAWHYADRLAALRKGDDDVTLARRTILPILLRIAAAAVFAAMLGAGAFALLPKPHDRVFTTRVGGRETIAFADGSKIDLNTDTIVRARMTTHDRTIWLEKGEAFFQVKHDPVHPFIVFAGAHRITDLGTKFLIRRDPGRLEVALVEGRVRFDSADGKHKSASTTLTSDEMVTATGSTMFVANVSASELAKQLSWRRGLLVFKHTTLADAANEFNRYNLEKLLIADPEVAQLRIYGTFETTNVRAFTDAARKIFGLHAKSDGDEIIISR